MNVLPQFDEIHVISDIHMGGRAGFQVLKETARLAGFIRWVGAQRPGGQVALILNGDVIDTLAEDELGGYVAMQNAPAIVERIIGDGAFKGIWQALADFVRIPGRTLVVILGNHDLEMAFPAVQRLVLARLAGEDLAARARVEFSTIGAGYPCKVGNATVFCTHGNEVDEFNFVRYENLSRLSRRLNAGRTLDPDEWRPNAGAKMVRDVMNAVKHRYRWVDLLKPEVEAAMNVLAVLDSSMLAKLPSVLALKSETVVEKFEMNGRLSAPVAPPAGAPRAMTDQMLGANLRAALRMPAAGSAKTADDMMRLVEPGLGSTRPAAGSANQTLGMPQYLIDRLRRIEPHEALRRAIQDWIAKDRSFDETDRDATCKDIIATVSSDIDVVITGHTHLHRSIDLGGGRHYFNTGTWIRLMRFTEPLLASAESFKPVYDILEKGTIEGIDNPPAGTPPVLLDQTSAVSVCVGAAGVVTAKLWCITGDGTLRTPVGATFTRQ